MAHEREGPDARMLIRQRGAESTETVPLPAESGERPTLCDITRCRARWLPALMPVAFLLPIILLYWQLGGPSGLLADPSTGVHVRTGQWILAHRAIPRHNLFSFTLAKKNWWDWEWLSDVIFAGAYLLHGLSGVTALSLALLCVTAVAVYRGARVYAGPIIAGGTCALVMATTTVHWLARPHLFTWLALAMLCLVLEKYGRWRRVWILAAGMALWVNLHPGFIAGFLVLGAWLAGAGLGWRLSKAMEERARYQREIKWCGMALLVCAATTLANPYFLELHRHVASYLLAPSPVTVHVSEWLSPDFHNPRLAWFELLLPLAAAAGVWHGLKGRFNWCVLIFGFMHLALLSVRNVPLFAIACATPVAAAAEEALAGFDFWRSVRTAEATTRGANRRSVTVALWALGIVAVVAVGVSSGRLGKGSGIPVVAIQHLPPGRLFTTDQWADYLIYATPGRKVFFDGRNDFYGPAFVNSYLEIMRAQPGWQKVLEKYGVTVALVPARSPLSAAFSCIPGWREVYRDARAAVFVWRGGESRGREGAGEASSEGLSSRESRGSSVEAA